ncbi:unnamed protein product, partial [Ectocarpus fasciculatus]
PSPHAGLRPAGRGERTSGRKRGIRSRRLANRVRILGSVAAAAAAGKATAAAVGGNPEAEAAASTTFTTGVAKLMSSDDGNCGTEE